MDALIMVAGHAVYTGKDFLKPEDDINWFLQPFQKGEPPFYIEHAKVGVEIAAKSPSSVLVFSGGQTRAEAGPISEALSYWRVAEHFGWWGHPEVRERVVCEEYARDSYENVLFSMCRFREVAGSYPHRITCVSWAFKEVRFNLHREAIRFSSSHYQFVVANNPVDLKKANESEEKNAILPFKEDPYGNKPMLANKRSARNPFLRTAPYALSCTEVKLLLQYKEADFFPKPLPWNR
jgi:hypothetical protein